MKHITPITIVLAVFVGCSNGSIDLNQELDKLMYTAEIMEKTKNSLYPPQFKFTSEEIEQQILEERSRIDNL